MTPIIQHSVPPYVFQVFKMVREVYEVLPELPRNTSCHALCRAFSMYLPKLTVRDGYFGVGATHSWLRVLDCDTFLIDVYPWVTIGGPLLVSIEPLSPWKEIYRPADEWLIKHVHENMAGYAEAVRAVESACRSCGIIY